MAVKIFLGLFAAASALTVATVGTASAVIVGSGTVSVQVQPRDGSSVSVSLPVVLADLALAFAPDDLVADLQEELHPVWPAVRAAAHELQGLPDFVLVEVRSDGERVVVAKRGDRLVIEIDSESDVVRVAVPLRGARRIVDKLAREPGTNWARSSAGLRERS